MLRVFFPFSSWFDAGKKEEKCFRFAVFIFLSRFSLSDIRRSSVLPDISVLSLSQISSCNMKSAECTNDSIFGRQPQPRSSGRRSSFTAVVRRSNPLRQNLSSLGKTRRRAWPTARPTSSSLVDAMDKFFQASDAMEEEIMLPSRLRDMPIEGKRNT